MTRIGQSFEDYRGQYRYERPLSWRKTFLLWGVVSGLLWLGIFLIVPAIVREWFGPVIDAVVNILRGGW